MKNRTSFSPQKETWTFFRGFFASLDRGRVWIVGTEDSKEPSSLTIPAAAPNKN
jgi:hypothetical protein